MNNPIEIYSNEVFINIVFNQIFENGGIDEVYILNKRRYDLMKFMQLCVKENLPIPNELVNEYNFLAESDFKSAYNELKIQPKNFNFNLLCKN